MEADMLITNKHYRQNLKNKKRIVIKVGSSSLVHPETGETDLLKLEQLVRVLCDLRNQGKDVVLVSSGAIGVGRKALGLNERPKELAQKQACASVGQGMLMMIYQKLFNEYSHVASQILTRAYEKIEPIIMELADKYRLEHDQISLVGVGGGATSLIGFCANKMNIKYSVPENAEVISSIGVALAMVRDVVERVVPNPTPDDIRSIKR